MPTRLDTLAHGFVALYLISVLAVPRASTSLAALACLVSLAAGFGQWRSDARAGFRHMAVLVIPAAAYLLHLLAQIAVGTASTSLSSHLLIGLLTMSVGLSGVPNRIPDVRRWLLPAAAVGAIGTCLLALYQVWLLDYLRPYGWLGGGPLGNGAIKFGDIAVLQALLAFVLALTATGKAYRLLGLAGLFCGMLALALTLTRAAFSASCWRSGRWRWRWRCAIGVAGVTSRATTAWWRRREDLPCMPRRAGERRWESSRSR